MESARESACVNDCDPGAAATGKMPVVPVRPYVGRRWNAAPGRDGARPSRRGDVRKHGGERFLTCKISDGTRVRKRKEAGNE